MEYRTSSLRLKEKAWDVLDELCEEEQAKHRLKVSKSDAMSEALINLKKEKRDEKVGNDISNS